MIGSAITAKGQATLPKAVRDSLRLGPGDRFRYLVVGGEVRLLKARRVMELSGLLHEPGMRARALEDMEAAIAAGALGSGA